VPSDPDRTPPHVLSEPRSFPFRSQVASRRFHAAHANLLNVTMIGAAAAAEHVNVPETTTQAPVLQAELYRIPVIEFRGVIELACLPFSSRSR
jgi:uncharacterized MAPEG superfamily protein